MTDHLSGFVIPLARRAVSRDLAISSLFEPI